jgi:hypothetical protein
MKSGVSADEFVGCLALILCLLLIANVAVSNTGLLPEFHMYVNANPELAGKLTNKEAGFIAEILTLAALQGGKNVMQDGSLRDSDWYQNYFARLRTEFPKVRQAIIHVTAPKDAVFQRAEVGILIRCDVVVLEIVKQIL